MSATAAAPAPGTIDLSGSSKVPFTRLTRVELRKMADTLAGFWLLVSIALITALIIVIFFFAAPDGERTFLNFMGATATPQGFLLPVMGILLVTSEWGQRTALTTFALEPSRARVIAAKVVAACLVGLAAIVVAIALAALATVAAGEPGAWENIGADDFGKFAILQISGILQGLAFGLVLLNSAAAIVLYFVLPIAFNILVTIWSRMQDIAPWVDLGTSQQPLFSGVNLSSEEWWQLVTSSAIWILLPFVIGLWRVMRAELK
ncbi:ABC transporter permease [Nocardioides guangzhouensis]|uniref:ABC transporter permease n=1 Tax=Nocardioides guangzhouensis TaxID=2497878 RepID=A0A4Q4Z007_9ACTN|nr:ABC transporter permease subunit [Nocardioides guangzhouensis]RYP80850.1 ABC transporter permease [Nocardioides guangzhouensis]